MSMTLPNPLREIWRRGGTVLNGWLTNPSTWSAELMAHAGFDSLTLDLQHGLLDYSIALPMVQAIDTTATIPFMRVPWNEPGGIMKALDMGAYGIICPMVNTRAEAERFIGACRYAPHGYRSYGPTRMALLHGDDYLANANELVITLAMIETAEALENVDAIISTPGLDGIYIGPSDLGLSLGHFPRVDPTDPALIAAIDRIGASARAHGKIAGMHTGSVAYGRQMVAKGFQFVTVHSDTSLLRTAAAAVTQEFKAAH